MMDTCSLLAHKKAACFDRQPNDDINRRLDEIERQDQERDADLRRIADIDRALGEYDEIDYD